MKNIFLNKPKSFLPRILIGFFSLVIFLGFLNIFQGQFKNLFFALSSPIQKTFWSAGSSASGTIGSFFNFNESSKIEQLINENQKLLVELASLQEIKKENQAIKDIIVNDPERDLQLMATDSIGLDSYQDLILIDRGLDDGILENMPVVNSQKVLFGKVFKVYKNFSKVMLISDKNSVVDVKIQDQDLTKEPILGVIKGSGELGIYLDLVPNGCEIKSSDTLITSGLEGIFPRGLLVGKITSCNKNDQKPFQQAKVDPFFNVNKLEKLFIITSYKLE
jgi:rod shape-determining protein MreC